MKIIYSILLVLLLSTTTIIAQVNLKNGLVACYPFNANAKDESGSGNDGTINGAILTTDRFGKANSAYNFNGSNQFIEVSAAQFKNQSYTYATWAQLDNIPTDGDQYSFISVGGTGGDQVLSLTNNYQSPAANGFNVAGYNPANPIVSRNWTNVTPSKNKWYHVVFTRDNTSVKLYVDGQLISDNSSSTNTNGLNPDYGSSTQYVTFGARNGGTSQYMQGSLDDIHLYNRPLNAAEVKALYDGTPTSQTITISASNSAPCGGDKITFTANGATNTSKYQWKVDGVNQGTNSKIFDYTSTKKTGDYTVKITVEVTDEDVCFPQKPTVVEQTVTVKDCTPPTGVNLKNGLVACYPFNANADDESGNNNNGIIIGATLVNDRFGKLSSAYNFNGSSSITVDASQFKNKDFSYSTWVKLDNLPLEGENNCFIAVGGPGGDQLISVSKSYQAQSSNGFNVGGYNVGAPIISNNWDNSSPIIGKWYHLVCTRDNNSIKLYVDGQLVMNNSALTSTGGTTPNYGSEPSVTFGGRHSGTSQFMQGSLDDIHLYNRAINADEVKALHDGNNSQIITITSNKSAPCGGDNITFTANGATNTSKYQWKVDGINVGTSTTSNTFSYNVPNKSTDYQVKISVEITEDEICFPNKTTLKEEYFDIKNCTLCVNSLLACVPFSVLKTK